MCGVLGLKPVVGLALLVVTAQPAVLTSSVSDLIYEKEFITENRTLSD